MTASVYFMLRYIATEISVLLLNVGCRSVVGFTPAVNGGILSSKKDGTGVHAKALPSTSERGHRPRAK